MATSVTPKVTVITPSYNQAQYLEQAMRSVLEQDYPNIEYIVMDGGSTDGSVEIIKKYADRLAYWVSQPDGGQSAAINEGLRHATGEIWAWMNADDAYLPGAVSKAVAWLQRNPETDILYGRYDVINQNGHVIEHRRPAPFDAANLLTGVADIPTGSTFLRRRVWERVGGFDESMHFIMDIEYWLRVFETCAFGYLPEILSLYRAYPAAKTMDIARSESRAQEFIRAFESFWAQGHAPEIWRLRSRSLSGTYLYAADLACLRGDRQACRIYLRKSLQFIPAVIQPRFARLLLNLALGSGMAGILKKLWRALPFVPKRHSP